MTNPRLVPGISSTARAARGPAARLREDVFGVVLPRLRHGLQAREAAGRIIGALGFPLRARIGIALYPLDARTSTALLRCAAEALAHARRHDRPTYRFY